MKNLRTLFVLLAAFLVTAAPSRSDDKVVRQQLEAEYLKTDSATRARDLDRVMNHYTTDFTLKIGIKTFDRKQVGTMMHWQIVATKEVKELSFTIQALVVKGNIAIATVKQRESLVVYKNKTRSLLASSQISEDTWIKTADGWRLKHQEVKHNVTTRDGKQIQQVSFVPMRVWRCLRAA
jgi:ketosteroid isomerase-like protein